MKKSTQTKTKTQESLYGFKSIGEAIDAAHKNYPPTIATLVETSNMLNHNPRTRDDFRWEVLMNVIFVMCRKIDPSIDNYYFIEIQKMIHYSAELHLRHSELQKR